MTNLIKHLELILDTLEFLTCVTRIREKTRYVFLRLVGQQLLKYIQENHKHNLKSSCSKTSSMQ